MGDQEEIDKGWPARLLRLLPIFLCSVFSAFIIGTGQLYSFFNWLDKYDALWVFFLLFFLSPFLIYGPAFIRNLRDGMREAASDNDPK